MKWLKIGFILLIPLFLYGWPDGSPAGAQDYEEFDSIKVDYKMEIPESAHNIWFIWLEWFGGSSYQNATQDFYRSTAANDDLFGRFGHFPYIHFGANMVFDSLFLNIMTVGNEDSAWIFFEKMQGNVVTKIDSIYYGDAALEYFETPNILSNYGDYAVENNYGYRFYLDCKNDGNNDIRLDNFVRVVWHLE